MRIRIYCEYCGQGLLREYKHIGAAEDWLNFMVNHMTNYKVLAAHKAKNGQEPFKPRFAIELPE